MSVCATGSAVITQFFDWLDLHNGAVAAVATTLLTIFTVAYVVLTSRLVAEQRRDRAIAYTPNLQWEIDEVSPTGAYVKYTMVNNSHASASYIVLCVVGQNGVWCRSDAFSLGPEDTVPEKPVPLHALPVRPQAQRRSGVAPSAVNILGATAPTGQAVFCQNALGHIIRIKRQTAKVDVWVPPGGRWKQWRRRKPAWVTWYEQQIVELVRL